MNGSRFALPTSSSPSIRNFSLTGSLPVVFEPGLGAFDVREHLPLVVGGAAGVEIAVAAVGSNGGEIHSASGSGGCTS